MLYFISRYARSFFFAVIGVFLFSACVAKGPLFERLPDPGEGDAVIVFYRPYNYFGGGVAAHVILQGREVTSLHLDGYHAVHAKPGLYRFNAHLSMNPQATSLSIDVKPGQTYYVRLEMDDAGSVFFTPRVELAMRLTTAEVGKDELAFTRDEGGYSYVAPWGIIKAEELAVAAASSSESTGQSAAAEPQPASPAEPAIPEEKPPPDLPGRIRPLTSPRFIVSGFGGNALGNKTILRGSGGIAMGASWGLVDWDIFEMGFAGAAFDRVPFYEGAEAAQWIGTRARLAPFTALDDFPVGADRLSPYGLAGIRFMWELDFDWYEKIDTLTAVDFGAGADIITVNALGGDSRVFAEWAWEGVKGGGGNMHPAYKDWKWGHAVFIGIRVSGPQEDKDKKDEEGQGPGGNSGTSSKVMTY